MAENFLPNDYSVPSKSNGYMKFKQGTNRFRILSKPILGYEWWVDEGDKRKPVRSRMGVTIPMDSIADPESIKHFWAMVVWNYETSQIQILEITQKGIQKTISALARNKKWGSPLGYDLVVEKTGEKLETEYSVTPDPIEPITAEITKAFKNAKIHLEALYDGGNPFEENKNADPARDDEGFEEAKQDDSIPF